MPEHKDIRWSQLKVGIVALSGLTLLAVAVFLITGEAGFFTETVSLHTYTPDAGGLKSGAVVRLAGVDIGNVQAVNLSGLEDPNEAVEIVMRVNSRYMPDIRSDSQVLLAAEGLLGERYINISRGSSSGQPIPPDGTVPFRQTAEFSELVGGSRDLLDNLNVLTNSLNSVVQSIETGEGTIGKLIRDDSLYARLDQAVQGAEQLVDNINAGEGSLGKLAHDEEFYNNVNATVTKLLTVAEKIESGEGTLARLMNDPSLYQDARQLMTSGSTMIDNINQGQGTLGKLATDEQFYTKLNSAVVGLDGLLAGIRAGDGTMGRLFTDPSLFNTLNETTLEVRELMADFRKDPKRFLTIQLKIF